MPLRSARRSTPTAAREGFRAIGRVERPWGLRGHAKILPLTDFPERFAVGSRVYLTGQPRIVLECRWQKGRAYLRLEGVDRVEEVEAVRGELLEVPVDDVPEFAEDEYYIDDIVGCRVRGHDGKDLGVIREVLQPGANDVYVVERPGRRDLLIPAISDVVLDVDVEERTVTVELLPGLDPEGSD